MKYCLRFICLFRYLFFYLKTCVHVFVWAHMHICVDVPVEARDSIRFFGAGVLGACVPHDIGAGTQTFPQDCIASTINCWATSAAYSLSLWTTTQFASKFLWRFNAWVTVSAAPQYAFLKKISNENCTSICLPPLSISNLAQVTLEFLARKLRKCQVLSAQDLTLGRNPAFKSLRCHSSPRR